MSAFWKGAKDAIGSAFSLLIFGSASILSQTDTVTLRWPNPPFSGSHSLNATFAEFRNTLSSNHFHNGVDIGGADGTAIYPSISGTVLSVGASATEGSNAYVRVKTPVPGGWKHITYLHIEPTPGLVAGNAVTEGQTIIGTILSGQGHVHLIEREIVSTENASGVEMNAVRSGGGLTPFEDVWSPQFQANTLQFRRTGTRTAISSQALFGSVDIVVRVMERNSAEAVGGTRTNNGTYALGFRIMSSDTQSIVYEPPDAGLKYRFDRMPLNAYVGLVFDEQLSTTSDHVYYVTNGSGASAIASTRVVTPGSLDVDPIPEGSYLLQLFTFDTRSNVTNWYIPIFITKDDLAPPGRPTLLSAVPDSDRIRIRWSPPPDPDLYGFRLYVDDETGPQFVVAETTLTKALTTFDLTIPPDFPRPNGGLPRLRLRLTAVDTVTTPNEGLASDTYVASPSSWDAVEAQRTYVIVDGFDRYGVSGASWSSPVHSFAVPASEPYGAFVAVGTIANESIAQETDLFFASDLVHWILGDESTADHTFTSTEQAYARQYLESGGTIFLSGSEVGWDLGRTHTASEPGDMSFYTNYLKASFIYDGNSTMTQASGVAGTPLEGYTWTFGQVFPEDYPDDIEPTGGASSVMTYNATRDGSTPRKAAIAYAGPFGASQTTGRLVYIAFPFESLTSKLTRSVLFERALQFLGVQTAVQDDRSDILPGHPWLSQNYPNPFNPSTTVEFAIPSDGGVSLKVFDVLGRHVHTLADGHLRAGRHAVTWHAAGFPSGTYFIRLTSGNFSSTKLVVLTK